MVLLFILVANFGWGFILDHYELVYSTLGVVHGAGYAAAHVTRVALWVMTGVFGSPACFWRLDFSARAQAHCRRNHCVRGALCGWSDGVTSAFEASW